MSIESANLESAKNLITPYINVTPILTSHFFNLQAHAELFFKCENL